MFYSTPLRSSAGWLGRSETKTSGTEGKLNGTVSKKVLAFLKL